MEKLMYCVDCHRVFSYADSCEYCNSRNVKELKRGTSINILGTKLKGKVYNYKNNLVSVIILTEDHQRVIKVYEAKKIKKIL